MSLSNSTKLPLELMAPRVHFEVVTMNPATGVATMVSMSPTTEAHADEVAREFRRDGWPSTVVAVTEIRSAR